MHTTISFDGTKALDHALDFSAGCSHSGDVEGYSTQTPTGQEQLEWLHDRTRQPRKRSKAILSPRRVGHTKSSLSTTHISA
jgi:hypothetical protein